MLYTKTAAARILNVQSSDIKSVALVEDGSNKGKIKVEFKVVGQSGKKEVVERFFAKKTFALDFKTFRQEGAKGLVSHRINSKTYQVFDPKRQTSHVVSIGQTLSCDCDDYSSQIQAFGGKGCCKHNYAVLKQWFGFENLSDYLALTQPKAA